VTTADIFDTARAALLRDGPMDVVPDIWEAADVIVTAVRPLIEAEVRERIARRLESLGRSDSALIVREWE
jgi:hypothetical protein